MKAFLRRFKKSVAAAGRWQRIEDAIRDCLLELGHEVVEQEWDDGPDDLRGAALRIHPHATRREKPDGSLFFKEMHLPGLFTVDSFGWGVEHSRMGSRPDLSAVDPDEARERVLALRDAFLASGLSRLPQPDPGSVENEPPNGDFILVPLQRPHDYVIENHSPIPLLGFLNAVADWAERRGRRVALKLHPSNLLLDPEIVEAARRRARPGGPVSLVAGNIHHLIDAAQGIFVINSSTGFESLLHGKPVATFGSCDYQWATFRADASDLDAAARYVEGYSDAQRREAFRFVAFYHWYHAYNVSDEFLADSKRRLKDYLAATVQGAAAGIGG
ncbi:MAG TPA: hypothetical protein VHC97_13710 [Thermoanaerobaculia bacterium]|jgi:hypothetical protein|nr:hypothetical protein [Thermoanaerobaculia bacterium]